MVTAKAREAESRPARTAAAEDFLRLLWGPNPPAGFLVTWSKDLGPRSSSDSYPATDLARAAAAAVNEADLPTGPGIPNYDWSLGREVYFGTCLQAEEPERWRRGTASGACAIPGLWADLDVAGPAHKSASLPPTKEAAADLARRAPWPPSVLVDSGNGLQAWWLFPEPLLLKTDDDRKRAADLVARLQDCLRQNPEGWDVDPTADLARVLRLPGTWNRKLQHRAERLERKLSDARHAAKYRSENPCPPPRDPKCDRTPAEWRAEAEKAAREAEDLARERETLEAAGTAPALVRVLEMNEERHSPEEWDAALPSVRPRPGPVAAPVPPSGNGKRPSSPGRPSVEERAARYLETLGPAVQGQGGDAHTARAAWAVAVEFGLEEPAARRVLWDWDRGNVPPWQDTEPRGLEAKLQSALSKAPGHHEFGRLAEEDRPAPGGAKVIPIRSGGRQGQAAPASSGAVAVTSDEEEEEDLEEEAAPSGRQRPTLDPVALHGLAGEFVRLVEPETEADPAALLFSFLLAAGHCFGRSPYFLHERNIHRTNLFGLLVGDTASGRKGTSWGWVQDLFFQATQDLPEAYRVRIRSGLSSGEGVLECMRPPEPPDAPEGKEPPPLPPHDPRVFVLEGEFAGILKNFERKGNTLSSILRSAWDGIPIGTMTRCPITVMEHHLTLLAHVTPTELALLLPQVETANGFLNRFLVVYVERTKSLPEGGSLPREATLPLAGRLRDAILCARSVEQVERDDDARKVWRAVYEDLACGHPGPMGSATSRALAQVSRLALVYALLDCDRVIRGEHLLAAVAAWKYCFDSAGRVFGDSTGSKTADKILHALRREPEGLTRTRIVREVLQGNCSREKLVAALALLKKYHLAEAQRIPPAPGARKASELWRAS